MNDCKIIWIIGRDGNEGKSWFQYYIESLYGSHRVARFDITVKPLKTDIPYDGHLSEKDTSQCPIR